MSGPFDHDLRSLGPAALRQFAQHVELSELRGVAGNLPDVYEAFGVDPRGYKIAVLKTASNFQYFAPLTSRLIRVDTPGPGQSDILTLPWKRIPRPMYPLEPIDDRRIGA